MVLHREGDVLQGTLDVIQDRVQAAAADVGGDVDPAGHTVVADARG